MDLLLRETTLDDLPFLFEHQRDPVANEMAVFAPRDWDAFVAHDAKIRCDPTLIRRTVVVDDEVVGSIGCFGDEQREVGYWYARAVWGRGIATAALAAFLDDVAERPLFAHVAVTNVGSAKVLQRCGFVEVERETTDVEEIVYRLVSPPSSNQTRPSIDDPARCDGPRRATRRNLSANKEVTSGGRR